MILLDKWASTDTLFHIQVVCFHAGLLYICNRVLEIYSQDSLYHILLCHSFHRLQRCRQDMRQHTDFAPCFYTKLHKVGQHSWESMICQEDIWCNLHLCIYHKSSLIHTSRYCSYHKHLQCCSRDRPNQGIVQKHTSQRIFRLSKWSQLCMRFYRSFPQDKEFTIQHWIACCI